MHVSPEQQAEIEAAKAETRSTRRVCVDALEEILFEPIPVLDHGFVRVIDYMGDDGAVVQGLGRQRACPTGSAAPSGSATSDRGLARILSLEQAAPPHSRRPFEMCEIK